MVRNIAGIIIGYIAMAIFMFITFTILYLILGSDGSFDPGSFHVSGNWIVFSIILSFLAALDGGWICMLISKNKNAVLILAGIVLLLGILTSIPKFGASNEIKNKPRIGKVSNSEAMQNAVQPNFILILNPILGAIGIFSGSKLKKEMKKQIA